MFDITLPRKEQKNGQIYKHNFVIEKAYIILSKKLFIHKIYTQLFFKYFHLCRICTFAIFFFRPTKENRPEEAMEHMI